MNARTFRCALVAGALGAALWHPIAVAARAPQSGQAPPSRPVLVTSDGTSHLQAWRVGAAGVDKVWEATPRLGDADWQKRQRERISYAGDGMPVIADCDGDGTNELLVMDALGMTIYGRSPAYVPFEPAAETQGSLAVGDVDGDGKPEIAMQRTVTSEKDLAHDVEVFKAGASGVRSVWKQRYPGGTMAVAIGDVDNDRKNEIVTAGDNVTILKARPGPAWDVAAEFAETTNVSAVAVGDVDRDGKNELVTGGSGGKLTLHKMRRQGQRVTYPVLWQSRHLVPDGMVTSPSYGGPVAVVRGLAISDVNGDKQAEIVAVATQTGRQNGKDLLATQASVWRFDGKADFTCDWTSDLIPLVPGGGLSTGLVAGDVDGDGVGEFVLSGRDVYKRDADGKGYRVLASPCPSCTSAIVGTLGELREPETATRVVPLYWTVPNNMVAEGQTVDVTMTLRNVWAEAKDVSMTVAAADPSLQVTGGSLKLPSLGHDSIVTTPAFKLTGKTGQQSGVVRVEVAAANGYRQTVLGHVYVGAPIPTYQPAVETRLADAFTKARDDNRRVLILWGTNGDKASDAMIQTTTKGGQVPMTLLYEYEVVRADFKSNQRLAAKYKAGEARTRLPFLTVLDAQGAVLGNQAAATFAASPGAPAKPAGTVPQASGYDDKKVNDFLVRFKPAYVDAQPLFTEALSQAKKEQKTLFVWFSAPW